VLVDELLHGCGLRIRDGSMSLTERNVRRKVSPACFTKKQTEMGFISLIWNLPDVLVICQLLSWLDVEELDRLDSAVCNEIHREKFLACTRHAYLVIDKGVFL
jgi:hypothetical protein